MQVFPHSHDTGHVGHHILYTRVDSGCISRAEPDMSSSLESEAALQEKVRGR